MPKWLVFGALAAVLVLVLVLSWLNKRSIQGSDEAANDSAAAVAAPDAAAPAPGPAAAAPAAQGRW